MSKSTIKIILFVAVLIRCIIGFSLAHDQMFVASGIIFTLLITDVFILDYINEC